MSPTIEEFEGLGLPFTNATPLVINGVTYSESGGTVRYFPTTDEFLNCFGGCLTTNTDASFLDVVFSGPYQRAGLFVGAFQPWTATADFYDGANNLLGTTLLSLGTGGDVFAGWEDSIGIQRIRLTDTSANGAVLSIDRVHREAAVPEPSTWLLLGTGLAGLAARRRFTKRT